MDTSTFFFSYGRGQNCSADSEGEEGGHPAFKRKGTSKLACLFLLSTFY